MHYIRYDGIVSSERPYRSTLREQRAEETRLRIRSAAAQLFATDGFSETTINRIAQHAGVATQTVYAVFGSKGGIVVSMLDEAEESADYSDRIAKMAAEQDPWRQMRLFASWIRTLYENGAPVFKAALEARSDPDVAALANRGDDRRRDGTRRITSGWASKGALRKGLEPEDAAQCMWLIASIEQYLKATDELSWHPDRYEQWLGDLLEREILKENPNTRQQH